MLKRKIGDEIDNPALIKKAIYVTYEIKNRTFSDAIHLFVAILNQQCNMK